MSVWAESLEHTDFRPMSLIFGCRIVVRYEIEAFCCSPWVVVDLHFCELWWSIFRTYGDRYWVSAG